MVPATVTFYTLSTGDLTWSVNHWQGGVGNAPHDEVYAQGEASMGAGMALFHSLNYLFEQAV